MEEDEPKPTSWRKVKWSKSPEDSEEEPLLDPSSTSTLYKDTDDVRLKIEDAAKAATQSLGSLLSKGERLSDIKSKADDLRDVGDMFRRNSREVKHNASWTEMIRQKAKVIGFWVVGGVIFVLLVIIGVLLLRPGAKPPMGPLPGQGGGLVCNCICPPTYGFPYPYPPGVPPNQPPYYPPPNTPPTQPPNQPPRAEDAP